jgi:hypothetical protein
MQVLYMSGYAGDAISEVVDDASAFIAKPFAPSALLNKTRETIDDPRPPGSRA